MAQIKDYSIIPTINDSDLLLVQTSIDGAYRSIKASDLKTYFGTAGSSTTSGGTTNDNSFPVRVQYRMSAQNIDHGPNPNLVYGTLDLSNNGIGGLAANQNYPELIPSFINGKPAIKFSGNGQYIDLFSAPIIPNTSEFVVFQVVSYTGNGVSFSSGGSNWGFEFEASGCYAISSSSEVDLTSSSLINNGFNIICSGRFAGDLVMIVNGNKISKPMNLDPLRGSNKGFQSRTILGAFWNGSALQTLNGYITDTCVKVQPTIADINAIGNYYADQYKLTWNRVS